MDSNGRGLLLETGLVYSYCGSSHEDLVRIAIKEASAAFADNFPI
jgi:hypothetical protein